MCVCVCWFLHKCVCVCVCVCVCHVTLRVSRHMGLSQTTFGHAQPRPPLPDSECMLMDVPGRALNLFHAVPISSAKDELSHTDALLHLPKCLWSTGWGLGGFCTPPLICMWTPWERAPFEGMRGTET